METANFDRSKGIGGSDIPVILGLSTFKTPYQLYLEKRGEPITAEPSQQQKNIMESGNRLEPMVVNIFEEQEGVKIERRQEVLRHNKYDFLWGTIDGMANNEVIEIKTTLSYSKAWKNGVPPYALAQALFYSHLANAAGFKILAYSRDNGILQIFNFMRNGELEQEIVNKAIEFWNNTQKGIEPPATNYKELQHKFRQICEDKKEIATKNDLEIVNEMLLVKQQLKQLEKKEEELKIKLCERLGDAPILVNESGDILAAWVQRKINRVSVDILKNKHKDIYEQCRTLSTVRNFLLKAESPLTR